MAVPAPIIAILDRLTEYLAGAMQDCSLVLLKGSADGTVSSQENEWQISHALKLF